MALTSVATANYGLFRFAEPLASPCFRMRCLVRSLNVGFMWIILLGEYSFSNTLGRPLVLLTLIAIDLVIAEHRAH